LSSSPLASVCTLLLVGGGVLLGSGLQRGDLLLRLRPLPVDLLLGLLPDRSRLILGDSHDLLDPRAETVQCDGGLVRRLLVAGVQVQLLDPASSCFTRSASRSRSLSAPENSDSSEARCASTWSRS
jgi:hypothetical protein